MNEIEQKLISLGLNKEQAYQMIKDVGDVISRKILSFYLTKLDSKDLKEVESIPHEEIPKYLSDNKSRLPELTKEEITEIAIKTWEDYFDSIKNN